LIDLGLMAIRRDISADQERQNLWGDLRISNNLLLCTPVLNSNDIVSSQEHPTMNSFLVTLKVNVVQSNNRTIMHIATFIGDE
jgi:hypothetical protein